MPDVGALVPNGRGGVHVQRPAECPNGHQLGPGQVTVGSYPCGCGTRHMTWRCTTCDETICAPPKGERCD
ncbi:hypothetical protein [Mycolicibacterium canariasense]|uniref:hypothetical protein n=1 Tax=Mycolicibacterium canariasense TaxID=228230 RepID=UPI0032D57627